MDNGMISLITGDSFKTQDLQLNLQGSHPERYGPNLYMFVISMILCVCECVCVCECLEIKGC